MSTEDISNPLIDQIQAIRANNNKLWMMLLKLALRHNPAEARCILMDITVNDREISSLVEKLAND